MATNLATAHGQDTFLLDFIGFVGLSRIRSPSRARKQHKKDIRSDVLFCTVRARGNYACQADGNSRFASQFLCFPSAGIVSATRSQIACCLALGKAESIKKRE